MDETADGDVVCHGRDDAGHVRGVLPNRKKAAGIGRSSDEGQIARQVAIRGFCAFAAGEPAQIEKRHIP